MTVSPPRKILHILSGATGGATMSALGLMQALKRAGILSCAVCADYGDNLRDQILEATNGEVLFIPLYWWTKRIRTDLWKRPILEARQILKTGWARFSALRVAKLALRHGANLLHTHNIMPLEGGLAAQVLHLPHVQHVREMLGPGQPFRLPVEGVKLGRLLSRRASKVVANSHATAGQIRAWLPAGLLDVVPNGIDLSRFQVGDPNSEPELRRSSGNKIVVAMVGSLSSRSKNHALFVDAAARIDRRLDVEFRIYGDDPRDGYANEVRGSVHRAGFDATRFSFRGHVPDPALIMSEIDVLVQPTHTDSFGRVLVEAMAAGLPVAGTRGGGAAEIVDDGVTGLLAPPNDAPALGSAIQRLVEDRGLRREMGRCGRERAERFYSLEAHAAGMMRVYEEAMRKPLSPWRLKEAS
jgi:glycosyltransferase involved in cell wall biosynthesis